MFEKKKRKYSNCSKTEDVLLIGWRWSKLESAASTSMANWCQAGPCGVPGHGGPFVPISYRQDSSLHDLLSIPNSRTVANQRRNSNKTTWSKIKGPERLLKIRRPDNLKPCTHPNLVSKPTLLKLCRRKNRLLPLWSLSHTLSDYVTFSCSPGTGHNSWVPSLLCFPLCLAK